ncbi:protein-glutamate methylesterase/protein-glutamine glutaminase [Uliginosibacterium sp. H1]|uniref:protein-glutamate methylesterase/protein-glutamine glutaminase n=1 Tax=Uliginosibacterium sp. H1 TaxID=3114757 RepID=UPI002E186048|nr:chemotaxis response regulator protein-glutamate methylesterase [Uliginosibacterium sp. H1]
MHTLPPGTSRVTRPAIRVLVVDDSVLVRQAARELLDAQPDIRVIDVAFDPIHAMERMQQEWPDVIVLDLEMPRMDGLSFLRKLMAERPTPVVVCSSLVGHGAQAGIDALAAGAVSLIPKPKIGVRQFFEDESLSIVAAVRAAAQVRISQVRRLPPVPVPTQALVKEPLPRQATAGGDRVIALGASTGGTQALETLLTALPERMPGIVIVQHMPDGFTKMFARRLDSLCKLQVREAVHGERVLPGLALIAPAGRQMRLVREGGGYTVDVVDGPVINRHRPSVDCLFGSVARAAGRNAIGALMTGMGDDGALGLKEMFDAGAMTIAEAEESCVVFGMPREAIRRGAARQVVPLPGIAGALQEWSRNPALAGAQ